MTGCEPHFVRGSGVFLYTECGQEWLDCASGTFNVPLGYSNPEIVEALINNAQLPFVSSPFVARRVGEVIDRLCKLAPGRISTGMMKDITGSSANEAAIKAAQKASGKTDVLSLFYSHHGQSAFSTAISGNAYRRKDIPAARTTVSTKVPAPYCYRCHYRTKFPGCGLLCVEAINDHIECATNGQVACFIVEPVLGNGGNIVPPPGYFQRLRQLCDEHDIQLIADEVQTGLGRTGEFFGSDSVGLTPDMIVLSKGLGGIGLPIAAVLFDQKHATLQGYEHSTTGAGGILGIEAACKTIDEIAKPGFLEGVRERGALLGRQLLELCDKYPVIGDVRGLGMMWGLEVIRPDDGQPNNKLAIEIISRALHEEHLILRVSRPSDKGNVIKVRPPLVVSEEEIDAIIRKLDRILASTPQH